MKLFWSGFLLSLSLCLDLGIVNVALIRTGIQRGATRSFALGAGSCFGDLFYAAIAMLGVSVFLQSPPVRWALWLCGSAVLLGFAVKMFREGHSPRSLDTVRVPIETGAHSSRALFLQGILLALASPSAILWFATIGGAMIASTAHGSPGPVWLFFCGFFAAGLLWSLCVAVVSAQGRRFGTGFVRILSYASALIFVLLALKILWTGYRDLVSA
ncbi:MAG TPA: LysE family transporter [Verrucomicrobia bacterium]|nr:LysE family transporter [Verrucomicrobiota bacterium]HOP97191.1 LysE family transporter [Verrucomicrobiota bacterium]HPU55460.1 LysE family transporter [Verrucomicrobiota bacterium]